MRHAVWVCLMIERAASLLLCLLALLFGGPAALPSAGAATGPAGDGQYIRVDRVEFCVASTPDLAAPCKMSTVALPHRWRPEANANQWGRYRIDLTGLPSVPHGIVLSGLSPNGEVIVGSGPDEIGAKSARRRVESEGSRSEPSLPRHTRYQPQWFLFQPDSQGIARVEIISRGNIATANGLKALWVAPAGVALTVLNQSVWLEVILPMMLAAAAALAGTFSMLAGRGGHLTARLARLLGLLGWLIALRIAMNHVIEPPVDLAQWSRLGIALLMLIDLIYCLPVVLFLRQSSYFTEKQGIPIAVGLALATWLLPEAHLVSGAMVIFSLIGLAALGLTGALATRVLRTPEPVGIALLFTFGGAVLAGLLDLLQRLSVIGTSFDSFQRFTSPILLVIVMILLMRENLSRHKLEGQLVSETQRREGLLRDLHDGVGSRLVALSFRARRNRVDPSITKGIEELLRELQLIQQTVRNEAATLGDLLAEIRTHYSDLSETEPLMQWEVEEGVQAVELRPEQAVATLRIIQEAIANAIRHGEPRTITVRASTTGVKRRAEVSITDDGRGSFRIGPHGGMRNMLARAQGTGLSLSFDFLPGRKMVRIEYPEGG